MIASHYAKPLERALAVPATIFATPDESDEAVMEAEAGDRFDLLDNSLGWAWGYAGDERRVGYVRAEALS